MFCKVIFKTTAVTMEGANYYAKTASHATDWENDFKWIFEIEAPEGTRGAYVSHVTKDNFKPEMEFLLQRDTVMEIIEFDEANHYAKLRIVEGV